MRNHIMDSREKTVNQINYYSNECLVKAVAALKCIQGTSVNDALASIEGKSLADIKPLIENTEQGELYFKWLANAFIDIRNEIISIDLDRVVIFEKAKKNTYELYENKIEKIIDILSNSSTGVYYCIDKIYEDGNGTNELLDVVYEIKRQSEFIEAAAKRLLSTLERILSNKHLIISLCALAILLTPIFYYSNVETTDTSSVTASIKKKIQSDKKALESASKNGFISASKVLLDDIIPKISSFLFVLLTFLGLIQKVFVKDSYKMKRLSIYRKNIAELATQIKSLQS